MVTNCPKCNHDGLKKVRYTWWGGVVGPALIPINKCESCGHSFNRNTGKPLTGAIVVYSVVIFAVLFLIFFAMG